MTAPESNFTTTPGPGFCPDCTCPQTVTAFKDLQSNLSTQILSGINYNTNSASIHNYY